MFIRMSKPINIYDAKTHLSRLINMAMEGDEVVISKAGRPLVKLVPVMVKKQKRKKVTSFLLWSSVFCRELT